MILLKTPLRRRVEKERNRMIRERAELVIKKNDIRQNYPQEIVKLVIKINDLRDDIAMLDKLLYK